MQGCKGEGEKGLDGYDAQVWDRAEVLFILFPDQDAEIECPRRGGDREVVGGNQLAGSTQGGEQLGPVARAQGPTERAQKEGARDQESEGCKGITVGRL